ncbi:MAG: metallophosphoesterase, partial [Firmicutes bacterium]|nr:metallophosphoesterase [Bacillota bacterium]
KLEETLEDAINSIIVLEIPLFLLIKNAIFSNLILNLTGTPPKEDVRKHALGIAIFSAAFWVLTIIATFIFKEKLDYPGNVILTAAGIFAIIILIYNLTLRKKITHKNIVLNLRRVIAFALAILLIVGFNFMRRDTWYTQWYINTVPVVAHSDDKIEYNEESGVYTITAAEDDFKILHLTDIHLGGSLFSYTKDLRALQACYAEIEYTHPDLVVVTGDMAFPMGIMSLSLNNTAPVGQFAAFMRNLDIPWAFTYGNHDTESMASAGTSELNDVYKALSYKTSGTLLYPYVQPEITGRNNQVIEVRNADGSLNTALFLIDSNSYTGAGLNDYDYIHDDQVEWYESEVKRLNAEEGHTVASLMFFHIPLQQYRTAYELYESGSDEVTYYFGANNEKMIDKVCCSDYPSKIFDKILELGSTTGTFCGHDHYNNMSLGYKGVRLTYGMSIDYLAMPGISDDTEQRGAELITLHPDSTWDLKQIPLESIE